MNFSKMKGMSLSSRTAYGQDCDDTQSLYKNRICSVKPLLWKTQVLLRQQKHFSSNEPKTKSSTIYVNTSRGTIHVPFIRTSFPEITAAFLSPKPETSRIWNFTSKTPTLGILMNQWKKIILPTLWSRIPNSYAKKELQK